jgi:hypothetical protein
MPALDENELASWCEHIRIAHLAALESLPCDVCVIADYAYILRDRKGAIVEEGSTVGNLILPHADETWRWEIAPLAEESYQLAKTLLVRAWYRAYV